MLSNDIEIVNKAFVDICHPEAVIDAWYRIKTILADAQKTPTNTQSTPCFFCGVVGGKHKSSCHLRKVAEIRDEW